MVLAGEWTEGAEIAYCPAYKTVTPSRGWRHGRAEVSQRPLVVLVVLAQRAHLFIPLAELFGQPQFAAAECIAVIIQFCFLPAQCQQEHGSSVWHLSVSQCP
eukprot:SM000052S17685  [mRNA]  locus=s52:40915:42284:- [translate_table: standard]